MYRVYAKYQGIEYPLYEPLDEEVRILDPVLTEEMGSAGSFSFRIFRGHPYYEKIQPCKTEIILYKDQKDIFCGRTLKPEFGMDNLVQITCEGDMTYLLDSIQRPFQYSGNVQGYVEKLLEVHNSQVEAEKKVEPGIIVIVGNEPEIHWELTGFSPTLSVLRTLPDAYGGYFRIRRQDGKRYLDYVWDYGGINGQTIRFGENLLDLTKYVDATGIITCLIPQGGSVDYQDGLGETQTQIIDISSVNDGKDYIENVEAIAQYGRIWGTQTFGDITDPSRLLETAGEYLKEVSTLPESIEISAVDLSLIDVSVDEFRLGYWTNVSSAPHGIEQRFLLTRREINLLDPTQGSITLGRAINTLTGNANRTQTAISNRVDKLISDTYNEMLQKIANATTLITGGFGGYVVLDNINPDTGEKMHPWRILIMNTPDKETATSVIQINQNGIGFSTTGINGPYRNAWTIDGNLVADFITAGTMLADRIRGGILEVGGTGLGKDGVIRVLNASGTEVVRMDINGVTIRQGKLNAPKITGGSADFGSGLFTADDDTVTVGGFEARYEWGRDIFQSYDQKCGLSADPGIKGGLWAWFGWNSSGDFDVVINNSGQVVAQDFVIDGSYELSQKIRSIERRLDDLESGGGE